MRLLKIRDYLNAKGITHQYYEDDGCGTVEFLHRGLSYHIWEYPDDEGADSNVRTAGRMESYTGDYEEQILQILMRDFS